MLENAVVKSFSFRQVAEELGIKARGGNLNYISQRIKHYGICYDHFPSKQGKSWCSGLKLIEKRKPASEYLKANTHISSHKLKCKLVQDGLLKHQCNKCKLTAWLDSPIPIELNHIDGNHLNNTLENLEILCPNCHSLTPNYRGKKLKKDVLKAPKYRPTKIVYPDVEVILQKIKDSSVNSVAKELGISFNGLKKHLQKNNAWMC